MAIRFMSQRARSSSPNATGGRAVFQCVAVAALVALMSAVAAADYAAGLAAFNRKDFPHAFSEWIESAKSGDAHAQHGLGMLYELGQGVPKVDAKAAAEWYQKAAAQNYAPAINNLARLYADGRGVTQDLPKAIELWSRAAEAGNTTAHFNLGLQYANGSGVPKDMKKAAEHLLQAAESGLPEAQFAMAGFYRDGSGVAKDMAAARLWYERAATAGFEPARTALAALDKPAVSSEPAVEAQSQAQGVEPQPTEAPPSQAEGPTQTAAEQGAGNQATEPEPTAAPPSEQATEPDAVKEPEVAEAAKTPLDAPKEPLPTAQMPTREQEGEATNEQAAEEAAPKPEYAAPVANDAAPADETPAAESGLPVAESLTGEAEIYRIWLYSSGQEKDARSYWDKLKIQYPRLLDDLELDMRRYFLGDARGSIYRVFAGPFEDLPAAQKACADIRKRFGDQFCRPVLN
jgi:uncharacterized protein